MNTYYESKKYNAALYVRLSREDGDKEESESITNQKELIKEFIKTQQDIRISSERIDDGYSGVNFERPAFMEMLEDIKIGRIDCIIVKDLSRFGRNYIEVGRYIEKIFPYLGVRFIAINDNYDSIYTKTPFDNIMLPFKNLINDSYCRDISIKIRSQLDMKRKNGDFIGSFAPYGYQKAEDDKNKLIIDEFAAENVKLIYRLKIAGKSTGKIAEYFNELGILSPIEYKRSNGSRFKTSFKVRSKSVWTATAITRILKNEVYRGVLEQGKRTTANYKIKKRTNKEKKDWIRVEDNHEAIITKKDFNLVQDLQKQDTRISPKENTLYLFSGLLKCADCNGNMIRKTVPSGAKKSLIYYVCGTNKYEKTCSCHSMSEKSLESCVLATLNMHIEEVVDIEKLLSNMDQFNLSQKEIRNMKERVNSKKEEVKRYQLLKLSLYEDLQEGLIDKEEYRELKEIYLDKCRSAEVAIGKLYSEIDNIINNGTVTCTSIEAFKKNRGINNLTRSIVVALIDKIDIYEGNRMTIILKYQCKEEMLQ